MEGPTEKFSDFSRDELLMEIYDLEQEALRLDTALRRLVEAGDGFFRCHDEICFGSLGEIEETFEDALDATKDALKEKGGGIA